MIVEGLHLEAHVARSRARHIDGMSHRSAVVKVCTAGPVVSRTIFNVGGQPIEKGQLVQG